MLKRFFGFLLVFLLGALSGAAFLYFSQQQYHAGKPDFVADLSRSSYLIDAAMKERIEARIPLGSKQEILINFLKEQGFKPRWGESETAGAAFYRWDDPLCPQTWSVFWSTDPQGMIAAIDTHYVDVCS